MTIDIIINVGPLVLMVFLKVGLIYLAKLSLQQENLGLYIPSQTITHFLGRIL